MASKKVEKDKAKGGINTLPFYIVLVILFVLFIIFQGKGTLSAIFGIALFLMIVILIVIEITIGIQEEGFAKNIIEIVAAVLIVVVLWFVLKAALQTNYPLDVVPSCSMLPNLKRGDLIVLHGVKNVSQLNAPVLKITNSDYNQLKSNTSGEFLSCVAYKPNGSLAQISQIIGPGYQIGLYSSANGGQIVQSSQQNGKLIQYTCGSKTIQYQNGTTAQEAYTTAVTINGTTIYGDANNSIVVYGTVPQDYFYKLGDSYIVHRVYAILNESGNYLVLTKGDNNPGLDIQYGNYPFNITSVQGKVVSSIPYVGYLKLALSNSFVEPAGCNSTVVNN
jgi:signal peptidase I